ncbi:MAG TPA: hypothetical protein PKC59_09145 [Burkholderiaceae bacterium]|nr:hypothetical protein [Burkholderiaceae bacterium]HMX10321.1 hypothetical protein [Burkholderiaceae bacterium]HMY99390.1 hypothetical protein [Burkholderiaceae bacterium]HNB43289.1 hypothetical protein [Burkholderiaceae bacterium]HNG79941.1 hypothetical protein [Burkholderiaceae bacterium]
MLPRPEVTEFSPDDLPTEFRCVSAFAPLMASLSATRPLPPPPVLARGPARATTSTTAMAPAAPGLELALLERFQRLMAAEGLPVQLARMGYDRLYARDRLSLGCRSTSWPLLQLSRQLWRLFDEPSGGSASLH